MLRVVTRAAATAAWLEPPVAAAAARAFASSASSPPPSPPEAAALSRFSDARAPSKKQADAYYSRIAAKLDKTHAELSLEDVDRTLAYLEHIGLTKSVALSAVAMHPMLTKYLPSTVEDKVEWLRANGVTGPLLVRAIGRHPNILGVREQALLDVKEWYIAQGVPASKLPFLISVFPQAVSASIRENLEPKRQFLLANGLSPKQVVGVLQRCPQFMSIGLERLEYKIALLKERGLADQTITNLLTSTPEVLGLAPDSIDAKLRVLDELLGSREATAAAWAVNPRIIMSKSAQLRRAYAYLTTVVGLPRERIYRHPAIIMRNVDRIVQPRFEFLWHNSFLSREELVGMTYWIVISDSKFKERFPGYESSVRKGSSDGAKPAKLAAASAA